MALNVNVDMYTYETSEEHSQESVIVIQPPTDSQKHASSMLVVPSKHSLFLIKSPKKKGAAIFEHTLRTAIP